MPYRRGALHDPDSPALAAAIDYASVKVAGAARDTDWFAAWNWQPDGDVLLNDIIGCCVPAADLRLIQAWKAAQGIRWRVPHELVRLRYAATGGYQGTPETDQGTTPQVDCFDWAAAPIVAGEEYRVRWCSVQPGQVVSALRRGPLLLTIGLTMNDADDTDLWSRDAEGPLVEFHRVVCGGTRGGALVCLTYGFLAGVAPSRVVGADLMLMADGPVALRTAGIDWAAV